MCWLFTRASRAGSSAGPTNAAVLRKGAASGVGYVRIGAAALGSTVQKDDPGLTGRTIPVTTRAWPAADRREPTCNPSRAAVAAVTATWKVAESPFPAVRAGSEPATRRA